MADASIIDIGGVQWNVKDKEARERVATLEKKTSANFDYTLNEKEIGTWLDGKKIYRLILQGNTTTRLAEINLNDKNIKNITKLSGVFTPTNGNTRPFCYNDSSIAGGLTDRTSVLYYRAIDNTIVASFSTSDIYSNVSFIIQLEYTKNE